MIPARRCNALLFSRFRGVIARGVYRGYFHNRAGFGSVFPFPERMGDVIFTLEVKMVKGGNLGIKIRK